MCCKQTVYAINKLLAAQNIETNAVAIQSIQNTVSSTAMTLLDFGFTQAEIDASEKAIIFINTNSLRIDWSGNVPTTIVGAVVNGYFELTPNENLDQLQMIRNGATDAEVFIVLEG